MFACVVLVGCVQRKLTVTSEPSGALVTLNGMEAGRTPFTTDFTWYGYYDVEVRREGHETLKTQSRVIAPWWQWVPIDLVAELMPWRPTDRQTLHYKLEPRKTGESNQALIERGATQREKTNEGLPPVTPTTQPVR
jgi:hypothetical protein